MPEKKYKKKKIFVHKKTSPNGEVYLQGDDNKSYRIDQLDARKHFVISGEGDSIAAVKGRQIMLAKDGYYNGKIDGIWGPKTDRADSTYFHEALEDRLIRAMKKQ